MECRRIFEKPVGKKYIQIRHWDYWWCVYGCVDAPVSGAEFSITDDKAGNELYFHLDLYTLPALREYIISGEFIEKDDKNFPYFQKCADQLLSGSIDYFVGGLYYRDDTFDLARYNQFWQEKKTVFSVKSPERVPYYAALFICEEEDLLPDRLVDWMQRLSPSLFHESFYYEIADMPSYERAAEAHI